MATLPKYVSHHATNDAVGTAAQYFAKEGQDVSLTGAFIMMKARTGESNSVGPTYVSTAIRLSDLVDYILATARGQ